MKLKLIYKSQIYWKSIFICICTVISLNSSAAVQSIETLLYNEKFWLDGIPTRFYSNILIELRGNVTHEDSVIFNDYIIQLNEAVEIWDVSLCSGQTANLVFEINSPANKDRISRINKTYLTDYEYLRNSVIMNFPESTDFVYRQKIIHFYLIQSLSDFRTRNKYNSLEGSAFQEVSPEKINVNSIDIQILKHLYSKQKNDQYRNSTKSNRFAPWLYYRYSALCFYLLALGLATWLLIWFFQKGWFKHHEYRLERFLKQGLLIIGVILSYTFVNAVFSYLRKPFSDILIKFISTSVAFVLLGIVTILIIYFIEKQLRKRKKDDIIGIIVPILITAIIPTILIISVSEIELNGRNGKLMLSEYLVIGMIVAMVRSVYILVEKRSITVIRKKDLELARVNELHKQAELQSLRAKINPHFLYNALNSIASLATTDARKTEQMALALSDFFKYAINREQKQLNTLSEELNAIRTYLEIEKVRFGDRLNFEIDCPAELVNIQIPQLLIQPLVENSIKHGLSQITDNGLIRIVIAKANALLKIRVYDNGPDFPDGPLTGFGIQNTQERIALLYGAKASINWQNGVEKHIEISIPA